MKKFYICLTGAIVLPIGFVIGYVNAKKEVNEDSFKFVKLKRKIDESAGCLVPARTLNNWIKEIEEE